MRFGEEDNLMTIKTFGELFMQSKGEPITYLDKEVHAIHRIAVSSRTRLSISVLGANPSVRQAIRITIEKGTALVSGMDLQDVVLWTDTAPKTVEVDVSPTSKGCMVKLWNAWADSAGTMQAWIGNAGMLIEQVDAGLRVRCSDGIGEPSFSDLILEIKSVPTP
jgi:hypothetical protein